MLGVGQSSAISVPQPKRPANTSPGYHESLLLSSSPPLSPHPPSDMALLTIPATPPMMSSYLSNNSNVTTPAVVSPTSVNLTLSSTDIKETAIHHNTFVSSPLPLTLTRERSSSLLPPLMENRFRRASSTDQYTSMPLVSPNTAGMLNEMFSISPTAAYAARQSLYGGAPSTVGAASASQAARGSSIGSSLRSPSFTQIRPRSSFSSCVSPRSASSSTTATTPMGSVPIAAPAFRRSVSDDSNSVPLSTSLLEGMGALYGVPAAEVIQSAAQRRHAITQLSVSTNISVSTVALPQSPLHIIATPASPIVFNRQGSGAGAGSLTPSPASVASSTTSSSTTPLSSNEQQFTPILQSRPRAFAASSISLPPSSVSPVMAPMVSTADAVAATSWLM